jgi:general stress protein 26
MKTELERLYALIDDIAVAMMTTRRQDGHLRSRAMGNQKRAEGADLWFVTLEATDKVADVRHDPHVNLAYYKDRTREWISVSGAATISRDRQKIHALYAPDWQVWFPKDGDDPRQGTADDPRIVLIGVTVVSAEFFEVDKPAPVLLYELAKGWITGESPDLGDVHHVAGTTRPPTR